MRERRFEVFAIPEAVGRTCDIPSCTQRATVVEVEVVPEDTAPALPCYWCRPHWDQLQEGRHSLGYR